MLLIRTVMTRIFGTGQLGDLLLSLTFVALCLTGYFTPGGVYVIPWIVGFCAIAFVIIRRHSTRRPLNLFLNVMAFSLVALPVARMALQAEVWFERAEVTDMAKRSFAKLPKLTPAAKRERRDIYYIVLDRYARADQLRDLYGYDNTPFLKALRERGFDVVERSYSNYQRTAHSLASSLNMDYLDRLDHEPASSSRDWQPLYGLLEDFRLLRFLKEQGYDSHFLGTWWEPTRQNRFVSESYNWRAWPEMFRIILENSLLGRSADLLGLGFLDSRRLQCDRPRHKFERLKSISADGGAKFVFAHFLVPHPPFVLDQNGNCMSIAEARSRSRAENYIGQLKYTNKQVLALIDALLSRAGPRPIIVLQADEGPWPERYAGDEITRLGVDVSAVDWLKASPAELREKMGILNAQFLPGPNATDLPANATPVNTFRRILKTYFGADLDVLPDRQFVFESNSRVYRFHDVTSKVSTPPPLRGSLSALDD